MGAEKIGCSDGFGYRYGVGFGFGFGFGFGCSDGDGFGLGPMKTQLNVFIDLVAISIILFRVRNDL